MIIYIVKQYGASAKEDKTLYKGNDLERAQFVRNNNSNAFILVTHSNKKH